MLTEKRAKRIKKVLGRRRSDIVVVFEDIYDPHNAEAVFRTCEAFGIHNVYLIFEKQKYFNPKKIGGASSASANKWLNFEIFRSTKECLEKLKKEGFFVIATALESEAEDIFSFDFRKKEKIALLVGNEKNGLSVEALSLADRKIFIPMKGFVQSLNLSVASAIFIFEISRQKNKAVGLAKKTKVFFEEKWTSR